MSVDLATMGFSPGFQPSDDGVHAGPLLIHEDYSFTSQTTGLVVLSGTTTEEGVFTGSLPNDTYTLSVAGATFTIVVPDVGARASGTLDDASAGTNGNVAFRRDYVAANGINGSRGDGITGSAGDVGNSLGASFFISDFIALTHPTKGSMQGNTIVGTIQAGSGYAEMGGTETVMTAQRDGVYIAGHESLVTATNISRACGHRVFMSVNHTLAAYSATLGSTSTFAVTGPRTFSSESIGSQPAGTAFNVTGDHEFGLRTQFANQAKFALATFQSGNTVAFFSINGQGALSWGPGSGAADIHLLRNSAGLLQLTENLYIGGTTAHVGVVSFFSAGALFQGAAASQFSTSVGAAGGVVVPATCTKFGILVDQAGTQFKFPVYAA